VAGRTLKNGVTAALVAVAALLMLSLLLDLTGGGAEATTLGVTLLVAVVVVVAVLRGARRRVVACARNAARHRPGAVVVPGVTTAEMPAIARHQGSSARGWSSAGGSAVAVVVTPTGLEVWGRRDTAPRWVVQRTRDGVTSNTAAFGGREVPAVWAHDGLAAVVFVPAYRPLRASAGMVGDDVGRALADLGADPDGRSADDDVMM